MKRLVIMRHAKTEHLNYDRDFERQLTERGINDAQQVANALKERNIIPEKIISSPAARAIKTATIMAEVLGSTPENIEQIEALYFDYTTQDFVELIQKTPNEISTLFIIGHNPFMHYVSMNMSSDYDGHMPTASTVVLDFKIDDWKNAAPREGKLKVHLYPKMLKA